jgi:hypothetical protein
MVKWSSKLPKLLLWQDADKHMIDTLLYTSLVLRLFKGVTPDRKNSENWEVPPKR